MNRNSSIDDDDDDKNNNETTKSTIQSDSPVNSILSSFKKLLFQSSSPLKSSREKKDTPPSKETKESESFITSTPQKQTSSLNANVIRSKLSTPISSPKSLEGKKNVVASKKDEEVESSDTPHPLEDEEALFSPSFHLGKEVETSDEDFERYLERVSDIEEEENEAIQYQRQQEQQQYTYHYPSHYLENEFNPFVFIRNLPKLEKVLEQISRPIALPRKTRSSPPITLVLDLDETLVHCSTSYLENSDLTFQVNFNNELYNVYVRKRPHLYEFLESVSKMFEVTIFTASQKLYADTLLNILDPEKKYIKYRLFRDSCLCVHGNYMKDLTIMGRDLKKVVIVDNAPQAFGFQLSNGVPIESWYDDPYDTQLLEIRDFLETLVGLEDVRPVIDKTFRLKELVESIPLK